LWVPDLPCKSPEEAIAENRARARKDKDRERARGYEFAADAIERNQKERGIAATECRYKCARPGCNAQTEADIVFNNGQIAEIASRKAKNIAKGKSDQSKSQMDLQRQLNEAGNTNHKRLAKVDRRPELRDTVDQHGRTGTEIFRQRGYEVEGWPPEGPG
jgi:hypothetical protein